MPFTGQLGTANSYLANIELAKAPVTASASVSSSAQEVKAGPAMLGAPWAKFRIEVPPSAPAVIPPPPVTMPTPEVKGGPPLRGSPWFRIPIDTPPPATPKPVPLPATPGTPEVQGGPPLRGAPWLQRLPVEQLFNAPPPVIIPVSQPMPEVRAGPPMVGAPFVQAVPFTSPLPNAGFAGGPGPPPGPPKPGFVLGQAPFVSRVPEVKDRLRRFTEHVANIFDALLGRADIVQTGPAGYQIISGGFTAGRPPGVNDDITIGAKAGCSWVDTAGQKVYFCLSNAKGSAVWQGMAIIPSGSSGSFP